MSCPSPRALVALAASLVASAFAAPPAHAQPKAPHADPGLARYGIYGKTATRPAVCAPTDTALPLALNEGDRVALVGNTLLERLQEHGQFEAYLQKRFPDRRLTVRNLAWPADEITLQPRPENFADLEQHLTHERADVILAAFGFNESFAGEEGLLKFKKDLAAFLAGLKAKGFNGKTAPRVVLVSPVGNEDVPGVPAATLNGARLQLYVDAMREVAREQKVGFADVYDATAKAMTRPNSGLTFNGVHLTAKGYDLFSRTLFAQLFDGEPPALDEPLRKAVIDKDLQFYRRYRPLNSFYYTGDRNKLYGYLDFLPAMRNFDLMVVNRDRHVWALSQGKAVPAKVDDSNVPPLPPVDQTRGVNPWLTAEKEREAFKVDPRFDVNLFAGEEQFPDIANPIQMRWDARGRLWVSCSSTYPHTYPGKEPRDRLVILEDTDGDGRADKSTVFADDLHVPLSFEFGDGGVYVSEQPHLTFLKDTDGDGRADVHRVVLTGFGTEDSHHSLHDFAWTPDGSLIFRESVFHHSQVETPYGPVRQQNSGWFRFDPATQRLTSFGSYPSTNPWGVTFDDWGRHVASHPVFAAAFHAPDPAYPGQHPAPKGLQAYSGVCGHQFVDSPTFPKELRGHLIKVRYKPTNRVEILKWKEGPFGFDEEYVGDLLFSTNLSFIPVDLQWGPRGDLYVCDWYNPVKGHAQYSLRDDRRDRHSGRIWRITAKGLPLQDPPKVARASVSELLELLKRPEPHVRLWAKRELRERDPAAVKPALDAWVKALRPEDPRHRHHQVEALWAYRWIREDTPELLRQLLKCEEPPARAAAVQQLRYRHELFPDAADLIRAAANDPNGLVRMEAAIAASYVGTRAALDAMLDVFKHPRGGHLDYAIVCALGSRTLKPLWEGNPKYDVAKYLREANRAEEFREPRPTAAQAAFDKQKNAKTVAVSCIPERMLFTVNRFDVLPGQPVKLVFTNPDATDHNLVIVKPGALAEVGVAANEMARDPRNANSDFLPPDKKGLILHATPMVGAGRAAQVAVLRFAAPTEAGIYPFVCTFPGHWVVMNGEMVVANSPAEAEKLIAARKPAIVKAWTAADFPEVVTKKDDATVVRGLRAFLKANCHQCHAVAGHGVNLGPDLCNVSERFKGEKLLKQILEPSAEIPDQYRVQRLALSDGRAVTGVVVKQEAGEYHVVANLLTPTAVTRVAVKDVDERVPSKTSPMPEGLLNVLTRGEVLDLVSFLEVGYKLPDHLKHEVFPPARK
jgi:putative heme-binding domain-containing protein